MQYLSQTLPYKSHFIIHRQIVLIWKSHIPGKTSKWTNISYCFNLCLNLCLNCLWICVLSRDSVLRWIPLPSDMNLHLLRVTKWLQKFTNGMFGIHSKRGPYLLNQINAPLLAYRLIPIHHYISIFPHERSNRRVETKGFQFLVRFLRKNRSYALFFVIINLRLL
jgi:hypothetical protein